MYGITGGCCDVWRCSSDAVVQLAVCTEPDADRATHASCPKVKYSVMLKHWFRELAGGFWIEVPIGVTRCGFINLFIFIHYAQGSMKQHTAVTVQ